MTKLPADAGVLGLTAQIVAAHVANNNVPMTGLPDLIQQVYAALSQIGAEPAIAPRRLPAVPIRKSIFPDYLVCLDDGKKLKMLKRHLKTVYGLTPEQYREKWSLPPDYPMVAPNYAEHRSRLAKEIGLGRKQDIVLPHAAKPRRARGAMEAAD